MTQKIAIKQMVQDIKESVKINLLEDPNTLKPKVTPQMKTYTDNVIQFSIHILALFFIVLLLSMGCAARPCQPAHIVMAEKGEVLSCHKKKMTDNGDIVDACWIKQKDGTVREKIVFKYHCEQRD